MDFQLQGKKALITGSTAGIGFATAALLLQEGAEVVINGRSQERVDKAVEELKAKVPGSKVEGIAADFGKVDEVNALLKQLPEVDILINNVSIFEPKPFTEIPDEDWLRFFEINVMSGVRLSRHYLKPMLAKNWGRIIFISSESAIFIPEEMVHYGMSKTAQLAISRGLAEYTKGSKVTVNAVLPGPTMSEGVGTFMQDLANDQNTNVAEVEKNFFTDARPTSLLQRFTAVEEIANMIVYVASPLSSATNGAALRADGGVVKTII
ncbi:SDR family NAD(P)-dependent oxidoreductase [Pseudobacter ginsenosidimutans]|jgi:NAD(P)-dependent dehydrogenase (short-subunit alcohol dehydrogenase family)|uniref:NAD(P)-dependent dehydrogenase (Short-subunit alcohol dehydrogenase family) n=1 Tax=Pseudobacter ginsenosidimutans TaxID=661488 RepID=A0A4Q7MG73_9BACT|nr:SDR family oxidoreductase [Pseudobacter ginsenosidimutans]RZS67111.1 NAD(P)-dependent dehydrogenase (short-subunit alcohol dehydrogenase family) [Pseudobacter ginsenosidimutans]